MCLILIATGIFMRLIPERSDKRTLKFVITLILITAVFNIDVSSVGDIFDIDIKTDNSDVVSEYENSLKDKISDSLTSQIEAEISNEYKKYDEGITVKLDRNGEKLTVNVFFGMRLSLSEREEIQSRLERDIGESIEFIYRE